MRLVLPVILTVAIILALFVLLFRDSLSLYFADSNKVDSVVDNDTASTTLEINARWSSMVISEGEYGMPIVSVKVQINGVGYDLGTAEGTCNGPQSFPLLKDQLGSYICWWAGGGTEFGLFRSGDNLVIRRGVIEEGSEEHEGYRGDFKDIKIIPFPS